MDTETLRKAVDLDVVIESVFGSTEPVPAFIKKHEKHAAERIEAYTSKVTGRHGEEMQKLVEEHAGELMDEICEISRAYFKDGIMAGAGLLLQLLGI